MTDTATASTAHHVPADLPTRIQHYIDGEFVDSRRRRHVRRARPGDERDLPAGRGRQEGRHRPRRRRRAARVHRGAVAADAAARALARAAPHRRHRRVARRPARRARVLRLRPADHAGARPGAARGRELPLLRRPDRRAGRRRLQGARAGSSTTSTASRSASPGSSRRGTRRSCSSRGSSARPSRPATPSCSSPPSSRRCRHRCGPGIFEEAGLPKGVFNLVNGLGEDAGDALVKHPDVPLISFTGESRTGQLIFGNAAPFLKGLSMELGGKSPAIVFADADLEAAIDATIFGVFSLNGERCTAGSRILVRARGVRRVRRALRRAGDRASSSATRTTRRPRSARSCTPSTTTR